MQLLHVGSQARAAHAALHAARGQRRTGSPRRSQPISALLSLVGPHAQQALGRAQTCSREVLAALHRAAEEASCEQGRATGASPSERVQVGPEWICLPEPKSCLAVVHVWQMLCICPLVGLHLSAEPCIQA